MIPTRYLLDDYENPLDWTTTIEARGKNDGSFVWVVMDFDNVMDKHTGKFESECLPSNRSPNFVARTRFTSAQEALKKYREFYPKRLK